MAFKRFVQSAHRWLGLAIAIQLALWTLSGVIMSWFPIELVKGETSSVIDAPAELPVLAYYSPAGVIAETEGATEIVLKTWLGRTVYQVTGAEGAALFDADTGERLSPINEAFARRVAASDFAGEDAIASLKLMTKPPHEYRGPTPVWRADFADRNKTRIYISPQTGEVLSRRNRIWRLYDFFWMLHIMDYEERKDFNNPLIKSFAATAFLFVLSGIFLVVTRLTGGRYREDVVKLLKRKRAK